MRESGLCRHLFGEAAGGFGRSVASLFWSVGLVTVTLRTEQWAEEGRRACGSVAMKWRAIKSERPSWMHAAFDARHVRLNQKRKERGPTASRGSVFP